MFAFEDMFEPMAKKSGMKIPKDREDYDPNKYPHWHVLLTTCLGQPMPYPGCHWDNAKIIADIPEEELMKLTYDQLIEKGLSLGSSKLYQ